MQTGGHAVRRPGAAPASALVLLLGLTACTGSGHSTAKTTSPAPRSSALAPPTAPAGSGRPTGTAPAPTASASPASSPPDSASPSASVSAPPAALPVAGSFIYHGGEHGEVVVRIAVHALRRVAEGTILDWSITPLVAPGVAPEGNVNLGVADLGSDYGDHSLSLIDTAGRKVYRPLIEGKKINAVCVCAAYLGGTGDLRLGKTTLFQLAFPTLPATLATVDVTDNGFVVPGVPLTPVGEVPTVGTPVDLAAPPTSGPGSTAAGGPRTVTFKYPQGPNVVNFSGKTQPMNLTVDGLYGYPGGTTLVWTVTALAAGAGLNLGGGLPVADYDLHVSGTGYKDTVGDGPGLVVGAAGAAAVTLRSDYATMRADTGVVPNATGPHWQQCLCSDWQRRETSLAASGGALTLATPFPALPAGTTSVSVTFPGTAIPALVTPVTALAAATSGPPQQVATTTWHADLKKQLQFAFRPDQWPTPVPDPASYVGFETVVDDLIDKTTTPDSRSDTQNHVTQLSLDSTVLFSLNSAKLLPAAAASLSQVAARVNAAAKEGSTLTVAGYVSANDGQTVQAGQALSAARAQAVYNALRTAVTKQVHWAVMGKGATDPVAPNDNETDRRLNRRVTITYAS